MSKRILIVDDAAFMREMLRDILADSGYEIAGEAADGEQAVSMFREVQPDLVTLDIVMPNMDGVTALKEVMAEDQDARIVMVMAVDQREKLTECIRSGAIDFIVKPFDSERLRKFFAKYLESGPSPADA